MKSYALGIGAAACFGMAQGLLANSVRAGLSGFFLVCGALLIAVAVSRFLRS